MTPIPFCLVAAGWRAEFFLRVARAAPDRFQAVGAVVRNEKKATAFEQTWRVPAFRSLGELLEKTAPRFVVSCAPRAVMPDVIEGAVARGMPVLAETPPAATVEEMTELYTYVTKQGGAVQVAEQYHLQPMNLARLAVANSGILGDVTQAQVSFAHDYHGISLIRRFMGVRFENATIRSISHKAQIVAGPTRGGFPEKEKIAPSKAQLISTFDFGDRLGVCDFTGDQYQSFIRGKRFLVRGERGELTGEKAVYLKDQVTPIETRIVRHAGGADGDLHGNYLKGVQFGDEWLYRNPFAPAPLTDEEVAIGECLLRMNDCVETGEDFYSLAEASQDHYLGLMAKEALDTDTPVTTTTQVWADAD